LMPHVRTRTSSHLLDNSLLADWFSSGSDPESFRTCVTCLVAFSVLFATLIYFNSHIAIRKCSLRPLGLLWLGYQILQKMRHLFGCVQIGGGQFRLLQFSHFHYKVLSEVVGVALARKANA